MNTAQLGPLARRRRVVARLTNALPARLLRIATDEPKPKPQAVNLRRLSDAELHRMAQQGRSRGTGAATE